MYKGSCLCGAVHYEISGSLGPVVVCHCSRCRKASGSAFNAMSPVPSSNFRIVRGEESLRIYSNDSGIHRIFCGACGSPIIGKRDSIPETVRVRIGTLDTTIEKKIAAHIFVGSKAEWYEILDDAPQHTERP